MACYNQLLFYLRVRKKVKRMNNALKKCPQRKGIILKIIQTKPKKPNSAVRKVAKLRMSTKRNLLAYIPGSGHSLHEHNRVLVRGGRVRDVPGMHFKLVKGAEDFLYVERMKRRRGRSKYGAPLREKF